MDFLLSQGSADRQTLPAPFLVRKLNFCKVMWTAWEQVVRGWLGLRKVDHPTGEGAQLWSSGSVLKVAEGARLGIVRE